jgi:hypothetical protein
VVTYAPHRATHHHTPHTDPHRGHLRTAPHHTSPHASGRRAMSVADLGLRMVGGRRRNPVIPPPPPGPALRPGHDRREGIEGAPPSRGGGGARHGHRAGGRWPPSRGARERSADVGERTATGDGLPPLPPDPAARQEPPTARGRGGAVSAERLGHDAAAVKLGGGGRRPGSRGRNEPAGTSLAAAGCSSTVTDHPSMIRRHGACPSPPAGHAGDAVRSRGHRYRRSPVQGHPQVLGSPEGNLKKSLSRHLGRHLMATNTVDKGSTRARSANTSGNPS